MIKRIAFVSALALSAVSAFAATENFKIDRNHSEATFTVRHMVSKVSGRFDDISGTIAIDAKDATASSVQFTIKTASINTGVADRDNHLRSADFFDAEKNPEITFKSTAIKPSGTKDVYNVTGDLTMRGVTKHITIPVEFLGFIKDPRGNEKVGFSLTTVLNRKDYGINWNKTLDAGGVLVSDEVTVNVNIEAGKEKPPADKK